ncbi:gluconokinase [Rhodoligotrophos defluvii]|uniref:gluconokinase n=1 Tax=Rhodoligotrophos defluvii TaxID=2561934 RepID=UPI0010C95720|nr:gluconokinase [Rhodoligotrophos defluvii]
MILVAMGVSGAGKSTIARELAERLGWAFAEGDDFHDPAARAKMAAGHALTDADRRPWLERIAAWIDARLAEGRDGVVSCSALKRSYRDLLRRDHPEVRILYLRGSRALIAARLSGRTGHFMPQALLESQFATLEEPGPDEATIVVDVDQSVPAIVDAVIAALPPDKRRPVQRR